MNERNIWGVFKELFGKQSQTIEGGAVFGPGSQTVHTIEPGNWRQMSPQEQDIYAAQANAAGADVMIFHTPDGRRTLVPKDFSSQQGANNAIETSRYLSSHAYESVLAGIIEESNNMGGSGEKIIAKLLALRDQCAKEGNSTGVSKVNEALMNARLSG
jgi:peroxiredoxin family protein